MAVKSLFFFFCLEPSAFCLRGGNIFCRGGASVAFPFPACILRCTSCGEEDRSSFRAAYYYKLIRIVFRIDKSTISRIDSIFFHTKKADGFYFLLKEML